MNKTRPVSVFVAGLALAIGAIHANAETNYPTRTVRIIVPYAPGGATDIVARVLADKLQGQLGQPFIVENKPGAYGIIAIEQMARAAPDGYTLMVGNVSTNAITPILYHDKFSINYYKDVVPVMRLVDIPEFLLLSTRNFAPKSVAEFVDYVKKDPGKVNYGSVGVGSYPDYDMALFAKRAGDLSMVGVPNRSGASGVIEDMLSGTTQAAFLNVASTAGLVKAGQLRPAALVNRTRLPDYPNVATMQEVGFPGVGTLAWQAMFAPAGTPKAILEIVEKNLQQAMQNPSVQAAFNKQNFNIVPTHSLDEAKAWMAEQTTRWTKITQEVKITTVEVAH